MVTLPATDVTSSSAKLWGRIVCTGTEGNVVIRGFVWGKAQGGPYSDDWQESGSFGVGDYSHTVDSLDSETTYYYKARGSH
jgi:hypothetical protein